MINEISHKVPALNITRKSQDENSGQETVLTSEPNKRAEQSQQDTVEISGRKQDVYTEKVAAPLQEDKKDVRLSSDVNNKNKIPDGYLSAKPKRAEAGKGEEGSSVQTKKVDNDDAKRLGANVKEKEEATSDSMLSAYGKKETEIGKVIRLTV